jgi:hypothetical protein
MHSVIHLQIKEDSIGQDTELMERNEEEWDSSSSMSQTFM